MKNIKIVVSLLIGFVVVGLQAEACPFTITNDKKEPFMILAWGTGTAIYLKPGQTDVVTPRKVGGEKESKLYFYQADEKKLQQKFTLVQTACAVNKDETKLKISQIEAMINKPTQRMQVIPFKAEGTLTQWWNALSEKVQSWFGKKASVQTKQQAETKKINGSAKVPSENGSLKAAAEKCKAEPAEQHEQCYFNVAKTLPGDVLPTGNYE